MDHEYGMCSWNVKQGTYGAEQNIEMSSVGHAALNINVECEVWNTQSGTCDMECVHRTWNVSVKCTGWNLKHETYGKEHEYGLDTVEHSGE